MRHACSMACRQRSSLSLLENHRSSLADQTSQRITQARPARAFGPKRRDKREILEAASASSLLPNVVCPTERTPDLTDSWVFKGGTCLEKCCRFSGELLPLTMPPGPCTGLWIREAPIIPWPSLGSTAQGSDDGFTATNSIGPRVRQRETSAPAWRVRRGHHDANHVAS
jgi:hypothetical protein